MCVSWAQAKGADASNLHLTKRLFKQSSFHLLLSGSSMEGREDWEPKEARLICSGDAYAIVQRD